MKESGILALVVLLLGLRRARQDVRVHEGSEPALRNRSQVSE